MNPAPDAARPQAPVIEGVMLSKAFGGVQALDSASFSAGCGEVHALVGENGAGKTTLIKLIGGRLRPDSGEVRILGRPVELNGPDSGHALGVWTVFQELTLLPWMTVAENLLLREPRGFLGLIDRRRMFKEAEAILVGMGVRGVDPRILIEDLSLAKRQIVEIVRAMAQEPDTLLLDEPTSSLGDSEVEWLFGLVRDLRARGVCIIFTSHRWNEVTHIADRITIFRNGKDIGAFTEIDESEAMSLMTGQQVEAHFPPPPSLRAARPMLQARGLAGRGLAASSLTVHAGEILGVGGLASQGHRELFFSLFGAAPTTGGEILVDGAPVRMKSPRDAARAGIALVPEDRKTEGLLLPLSVGVNLTLAVLPRISTLGVVVAARERGLAGRMVDALKIRTPDLANPVGRLSGGNQQKVLLARWLLADSLVFIPKCRRKTLYQELRRHLGEVFRKLALQKESKVEEGHLMPDDVHMLLSIPPKYAVSQVVGFIKGKSAIHMARAYGERKRNFVGQHFWARGFFVNTVGRDEEAIRAYIRNQEKEDQRLEQLNLWR